MFLIVIVLLGVFFSMGYIVGRNSPSSTTAAADVPPAHPANPIIVENPSKSVDATPPPPVESKPSPLETHPAPVPKKDEKVIEPAPKPTVGEPSGGQYLQVVATSRPDSELIAETLAKKGFHTTVAPGPNATLFRVLVGPLNGAADVAETRVRLEASGFKNPYTRKY